MNMRLKLGNLDNEVTKSVLFFDGKKDSTITSVKRGDKSVKKTVFEELISIGGHRA